MSVSMVAERFFSSSDDGDVAAVLPRWSLSVMGPFLFARFSLSLSAWLPLSEVGQKDGAWVA